MSETGLLERTRRLLEEPLLGEQDLDTKVCLLLEAEYLRRLRNFRRVDHSLTLKYGMSLEDFLAQRIAHKMAYTWDVEKDAMDWEMAVDGVKTMERKIQDLRA